MSQYSLHQQMTGMNLSASETNGQQYNFPDTSVGGAPSLGKTVYGQPSGGIMGTGPGFGPPGMSTGPPGMSTGPPGVNMGPPGMGTGPPGVNTGPPGMGTGPPGVNTGPPGMGMGPPGMGTGTPGMSMGPPGMSMGPPGMSMGPPGMNTRPSYPPGMGIRPGTSISQPGYGIRPTHNGISTGPPTGVSAGPSANTGMGMGPPNQTGMGMGPPSHTGMGTGPSSQTGVGMIPPSHTGMGTGPPTHSGMGTGPPTHSGMGIRPSTHVGMGVGPPTHSGGETNTRPLFPGTRAGPGSMGPGPGGMGPGPGGMGPGPSGMGPGPGGMGPSPGGMGPGPGGMRPGPGGMGPGPSGMGPGPSGMGPGGMGPGPGLSPISTGPSGAVQTQPQPQKINPEMMPNPIALMKDNEEKYGGKMFYTASSTAGIPPPLVTTQFVIQDNGNCSPRYMRSTLYNVPCTKDLINQCKIPLGVVVQPFASVPISENTLSVVNQGLSGPIRCNRCKAYMNPYCRFIDGGRSYLCPICQCSNEVPPEFFCHLDHNGMRTDISNRPELLYGSVEYTATKDYCKEGVLPEAPAYIFMIDVSISNLQSGVVNLLSQTMLSILNHLPKDSNSSSVPIKVGFVTYDRVLHFYNVKDCLTQPQMMVVSDINDVFVPLVDGFLVDLEESRQVIDNLMTQIPEMFNGNKNSEVILEPVVRAGLEALKASKRNGRLFIFHSNLPTLQGPGQLTNRVDTKLLGTDKEKTLLSSVGGSYSKIAQECVKYGVGVELFLFPSTEYSDLATLSSLTQTTGGEVHWYPRIQTATDGERLISDIIKSVSRDTGFDCVMRVRCSAGIRAVNYYGGFYMSNTTDIELGNIDSDKAVAIEIKHDDKMKEDHSAYIQAALLYTTFTGERRLRVHNMALKCSSKFTDIYQSCELDTIVNFLCKSVITASHSMSYKSIRESLTTQCAIILSCYRKHCSKQSPPGQLILPDSLKLLPLYASCILKSDALLSPPIVGVDGKCFQMHKLLTMNVKQSVCYLYPKLMKLDTCTSERDTKLEIMRCTGQKLSDSELYLISNGLTNVVWVGQHVSGSVLSNVFGVTSHSQVDPNLHALPALDNPLSYKIREVIKDLNQENGHQLKLIVCKQRDKSEVLFRRLLKEDKGSGPWEGVSYIDYLCQLHKEIREILN